MLQQQLCMRKRIWRDKLIGDNGEEIDIVAGLQIAQIQAPFDDEASWVCSTVLLQCGALTTTVSREHLVSILYQIEADPQSLARSIHRAQYYLHMLENMEFRCQEFGWSLGFCFFTYAEFCAKVEQRLRPAATAGYAPAMAELSMMNARYGLPLLNMDQEFQHMIPVFCHQTKHFAEMAIPEPKAFGALCMLQAKKSMRMCTVSGSISVAENAWLAIQGGCLGVTRWLFPSDYSMYDEDVIEAAEPGDGFEIGQDALWVDDLREYLSDWRLLRILATKTFPLFYPPEELLGGLDIVNFWKFDDREQGPLVTGKHALAIYNELRLNSLFTKLAPYPSHVLAIGQAWLTTCRATIDASAVCAKRTTPPFCKDLRRMIGKMAWQSSFADLCERLSCIPPACTLPQKRGHSCSGEDE
jgi:hypothetical protein